MIWLNGIQPRRREIGLASACAAEIAARSTWFIVDDPVASGCLGLPQICSWKMIPKFGKVVVSRIALRRKNSFCHRAITLIAKQKFRQFRKAYHASAALDAALVRLKAA
jgi:hypothetical protein